MGYHKQSYPLDHVEIKAFSDLMQLDLTIYETTALRKMSEAYVIECNNKNINAIAPYVTSKRKMISNNEIIDIFKGIATVKA